MAKPSERISEIENQDDNTNRTDAIIQYLDEQYEQNKPCEQHCYVSDDIQGEYCENCLKPRFTPV